MTRVSYPGMICGFYNNSTTTSNGPWYYVLCSQTTMEAQGVDDYWYVLPGYRFLTYRNTGYVTFDFDFDNRNGTTVARYGSTSSFNRARSVRVYFGDTEITISGIS